MKKKFVSLLFVFVLLTSVCFTVSAETTSGVSGFYNIGTVENITIVPGSSNNDVEIKNEDVNGDEIVDEIYSNSDKLTVTYSAAEDNAYYGAILVEGRGLPTKDNAIYYVDQLTASSGRVEFNILPQLPNKNSELTLYISCSLEDTQLISIPLNYHKKKEYVLGDINNDGTIDSVDALRVLKITVGSHIPSATEILAGDVNGDNVVDSVDAMKILIYTVRGTWN